jgi:energy-coupling factor transporter ATP-binding protein EcfA2
MPIQIIDDWEVSIRPCEMEYFSHIFHEDLKNKTKNNEYRELMSLLKKTKLNLVEVIELSERYYEHFKNTVIKTAKVNHIFDILDRARELIKNNNGGSNIIRYLLYKLNNRIIKEQYITSQNHKKLSFLNLKWGCIPFDEMPFITFTKGHIPKIDDLFHCIDPENRKHELFARHIKNNTERQGMLYTPVDDLGGFENIDQLMQSYNDKLYYKHRPTRYLEKYKNHIYIHEYEKDSFEIIEKLKELSNSGIKNYSNSVDSWLSSGSDNIDCKDKKEILKTMFESSKVALIYGGAGTGKTRLIEHISGFFHDQSRLYLANTHPAKNNLESRVTTGNSTFQTIASFLHPSSKNKDFDILIIDECSTVSNSDMIKILKKACFKLLILVGDVFQIESILFGNWFGIAQSFIPKTSIFELTVPFRTKNKKLLELWGKVRTIEDDILEHITNNGYSTKLDESIFEHSEDDEIILCLNYDGLYGINNINKFLQGNNKNKEIQWGIHTYKVGDPILFNESDRFKPLIHNNLKGKIMGIEVFKDQIQFDIEIDKSINELDTYGYELELLGESENRKSIIRFFVNKLPNTDEDDDSSSAIVPFQVAYAVSIHKAQGLEYNSVKVVITDEIEEMITHNIFYTAITRAKEKLKIYWTPETEKKILGSLQQKNSGKDVHLLKAKFAI